MQNDKKPNSRRKFVAWSASIISGISLISLGIRARKKKEITTVKMLTQDGTLVEVDKALLSSSKKKISNNDLKNWIKSKKT